MMASNNPNERSIESTASFNQPGGSTDRHDEDPPDHHGGGPPDGNGDDPSKWQVIVDELLRWESEAEDCIGKDSLFAKRFKILNGIGEGGFGVVYHAIDTGDGNPGHQSREAALKLIRVPLSNHQLRGFHSVRAEHLKACIDGVVTAIEEIRRQKQLSTVHGCVTIFDLRAPERNNDNSILSFLQNQPIWFTMPRYEMTLRDLLTKKGRLEPDQAVRIMRRVAETLQSLHAKSLYHRDLKPANIMLIDENQPLIADFGLAIGQFEQELTGNAPSGTIEYFAPEQIRGGNVKAATDIWAWGVILYQLITGELPFGSRREVRLGTTPDDRKRKILERIEAGVYEALIVKAPTCPAYLGEVIDRCLRKPPFVEFDSFSEVIARLDKQVNRPDQHRKFRAQPLTGRIKELNELEDAVRNNVAEGGMIGVWGVRDTGGIGKSAFVAELAERLFAARQSDGSERLIFPGGVLWVDLGEESAHDAARRWLRDFELEPATWPAPECVNRFHQLARERRPLIVLDNAQDRHSVETLLVKAPGVGTLVTTRDQRHLPPEITARRLEGLSVDAAISLLHSFAPELVNADIAAATQICQQCDFFPLHIQAAGGALKTGAYETTSEFADDLTRRGIDALTELDDRLAFLFDVQWNDHLTEDERYAFVVLSQFPGADFGSNFLRAYLGIDDQAARRLLVRLENASLLIRSELRYRFHNRVRDYATKKLDHIPEKAELGLERVWTNWEFVESELHAAGVYELYYQYQVLGKRSMTQPTSFHRWSHFVRSHIEVLARYPDLFFQQAFNEPKDSPVSIEANHRAQSGQTSGSWLEWINRPAKFKATSCAQTFHGHDQAVFAVAISPDGRRVVSLSRDSIQVRDLELSKQLSLIDVFDRRIHSIAISSNGRRIVGAWDDKLLVWDATTGTCERELTGHQYGITGIATSANHAVSCAHDGQIRVWDIETGECMKVIDRHGDIRVECIAISLNGLRAVSGSFDGRVRVWDISTGTCIHVIKGHDDRVTEVALSNNGHCAVTVSRDKKMKIWDLSKDARCINSVNLRREISDVAISGDGRLAVSTSGSGALSLWDVASGKCVQSLGSGNLSVALSADGSRAVSGTSDSALRVWEFDELRLESHDFQLSHHPSEIVGTRVFSNGCHAISASTAGTVLFWNLDVGTNEASYFGVRYIKDIIDILGLVGLAGISLIPELLFLASCYYILCRAWEIIGPWALGRDLISIYGALAAFATAVVPALFVSTRLISFGLDVAEVVDRVVVRPISSAGHRFVIIVMKSILQTRHPTWSRDMIDLLFDRRGAHAFACECVGLSQGHHFTVKVEAAGFVMRNTSNTVCRFAGKFTTASCSADGRRAIAGSNDGRVYVLHRKP